MSKRRSHEQWRSILHEFEHSRLSQSEFCRRHGLSVATLQYQLRRKRATPSPEESTAPQLLEVTPVRQSTRVSEDIPDPSVAPCPTGSLRVALSLDSKSLAIDCHPGQLGGVLHQLAAFHSPRHLR